MHSAARTVWHTICTVVVNWTRRAVDGWGGNMSGTRRDDPGKMWSLARRVALGMAAGCFAGIPQVVAAQAVGRLVGSRQEADIGPRIVHHAALEAGQSLSRPARWFLATCLHFGYAAAWGTVYAPLVESAGLRRVPPALSGGLLGAVIYALAFSRLGMATLTGAERHPDRRGGHEWAVQWTSALGFALTLAYGYRWLRERE